MVFLLFLATVIIFLVVDFLLRREDRTMVFDLYQSVNDLKKGV
jgi:hypothetical protein